MELLDALIANATQGVLGVAALTAGAFLFFAVITVANRNKLIIEPPRSPKEETTRDFAHFHEIVEAEIRRISGHHAAVQDALGDLALFRELSPQIRADEVALKVSPDRFRALLNVALLVFGWLLRPPTVRSVVYRDSTHVVLRATIRQRRRRPIDLESVTMPLNTKHLYDAMARELALKVIIGNGSDLDVNNWQALEALTAAIGAWPKGSTQAAQLDSQEQFDSIESMLKEARKYDSSSRLVSYNLGLIYYYRYRLEFNEEAKKRFEFAKRTPNLRLQGLAKTGLARCYAQDYHRFGRQTQAVLETARTTAEEAIQVLEQARQEAGRRFAHIIRMDLARAYACQAFAYHVTEQPDDIDRGRLDYEHFIRVAGKKTPAYVYNNLGYIIMAKAGRFVAAGRMTEYLEAKEYFLRALQQEPTYKFALANLGNTERLLGNHEAAVGWYLEAVEIDPQYTNGWNELAWAYFEAGETTKAEAAHTQALSLVNDSRQRSEVRALYARALHATGRHAEALDVAQDALLSNPENLTLREWLAQVSGPQSPAVGQTG